MGLRKYRADKQGQTDANGAVEFGTNWIGGYQLSLIRNCPCVKSVMDKGDVSLGRYTVYVRGEASTWFSIPAAIRIKGKTITGYLTRKDDCWQFRAHNKE